MYSFEYLQVLLRHQVANVSFQHDLQPHRYLSLTLKGSGNSVSPPRDTLQAFVLSTIDMANNTISCLKIQAIQTLQLDVYLCFLLFYTLMGDIIEADFQGDIAAPKGCTCQYYGSSAGNGNPLSKFELHTRLCHAESSKKNQDACKGP